MSTHACRFCADGRPADRTLYLVDGPNIRAAIPYCNAHAAALAMDEWTLVIRCMDSVSAVKGVPGRHDGSG